MGGRERGWSGLPAFARAVHASCQQLADCSPTPPPPPSTAPLSAQVRGVPALTYFGQTVWR